MEIDNNNVFTDNQFINDINNIDEITDEITDEIDELTDGQIQLSKYDIKDIIHRIHKLNSKEKLHILNILKQYDHQFTKNTNGYFFNLTHINDEVLYKLSKCIELIEKNRDLIKEMDKKRDELLEYYKSLIEEKLLNTIKEKKNKYIKKITLHTNHTNIWVDFSKITKVKRKVKKEIDPDILIKLHNKALNKFPKDSVFYRIHSKMRLLRSNKINTFKEESSSNDTYDSTDNNNYNFDNEGNLDEIVDDIIVDDTFDNLDEIENENEQYDNDDNDGIENVDICDDNEDICDENADNDIIDDCIIDENGDELITDNISEGDTKENIIQDKTSQNILFYKKLLGEHGFKFNENTKCMLIYQHYIA